MHMEKAEVIDMIMSTSMLTDVDQARDLVNYITIAPNAVLDTLWTAMHDHIAALAEREAVRVAKEAGALGKKHLCFECCRVFRGFEPDMDMHLTWQSGDCQKCGIKGVIVFKDTE